MRLRPWLIVRAFPANSYRFLAEWAHSPDLERLGGPRLVFGHFIVMWQV